MSQYACNIVENSIYNPTLRMYIDLGEYRYGVTLAGAGKPLVCLHGFSESGYTWDGIVVPGYQLMDMEIRIFQRMRLLFLFLLCSTICIR